jgi:hypothetical protein
MSNSSLGFSFIESTEKIKERLKPKKGRDIKRKAPMPKAPVAPVAPLIENFDVHDEMLSGDEGDNEDGGGLADVNFNPPPKPESTGVQKTKDKEKALTQEEQHPAEPFTKMSEEFAKEYYEQYLPFESPQLNTGQNEASGIRGSSSDLEKKLNYLIHMMEDQKDEKVEGITEEIVLYCFLGVFIIFVLDSFAKVGKYVR